MKRTPIISLNTFDSALLRYVCGFAILVFSVSYGQIAQAESTQTVDPIQLEADHEADVDERWAKVKMAVLGDIEIHDGGELLTIEAPERAYDAAFVPVSLSVREAQTTDRYIKELYIIADKNPAPVAGKFFFQPDTGWENLETRIRINEYTFVRAVAIMNDNKAYMVSRFVKASGGCSTPAVGAPVSLDEANVASSGVGKFKFKLESSPVPKGERERMQLNVQISHPNSTGMQFDQLSRIYIPAHFIHTIGIKYDGNEIIKLETNFSLSENPTLRIDFSPRKSGGVIDIYAIDSKLQLFEQQWLS